MKTLAALCCEQRPVRPDDFERHVLDSCFYPWTHRLRFFPSVCLACIEAGLELILAGGRLTSTAEFLAEVAEFQDHPANSGRPRREWKLRVSVTRLQDLAFATLPVQGATVGRMATRCKLRLKSSFPHRGTETPIPPCLSNPVS